MICKALAQKPDYFSVVRDAPTKTLRHEEYPAYKAHRPPTPDDFKRQIQLTKQLIADCGINNEQIPGYEADDIIGTLAQKAARDGIDVEIMTCDKDMKALICDRIVCSDAMKQVTTDLTGFRAERGFEPIQLVDYLALIGDASDNVPGVAGIGPKGATTLIHQFGTIENIYAALDGTQTPDAQGYEEQITPALAEKLRVNRDNALLSKHLITLMDVPTLMDIPMTEFFNTLDFAHMHNILINQYQFGSLAK
jgi:DNA polymerase I